MAEREYGETAALMRPTPAGKKIRILSGWSAVPVRLKFALSLGKYLFRRKRYPLFTLKASQRGFLKTYQTLQDLRVCKTLKFMSHYYLGLTSPRWPSQAFDHMVGRGGLNITAAGTPFKQQIDTAILGISRKCIYHCRHCYEHFNLGEEETVPLDCWKDTIKQLQEIGASIITFSGGEPMLRYEGLVELLVSADHSRSDFHLHTSGHGVTLERARNLKAAGLAAAAVGLDDVNPERHDALRGYPGAFLEALQAIRFFQEAGVFTYLNMCLTKDIVRSGDLPSYIELAKGLGVGAVRFLEPRPCGAYLGENGEDLFSSGDRMAVTQWFEKVNVSRLYRHYPFISYEAYFEAPERLGCMMGGHSLLYIDSLGYVVPCVFVPVSFGKITEEKFLDIFQRLRKCIPQPLHRPCPSLALADKIRAKHDQGLSLPVPFLEIQKEWQEIFGQE